MSDEDHILEQFDKLLQTLNTISVGLQLDIITKVEIKLSQYKSEIKSQINENNCDHNSCLSPKSNSPKSGLNLDLNSNPLLNIRKSERILNRKTQQIDSKVTQTERVHKNTFIEPIDNQLSNEEDTNGKATKDLVQTSQQIPVFLVRNDDRPLNRRKWRRIKDINELKCKYCGKIWRSMSHLDIHLRTHTGEKLFECQQCGRRFAQLAGLQVHQRRHNNDRRFGCDLCSKAFYTKIDLTRHKSSHKELRNITHCCEKCGKGFSDNRKLKNHIRYVHEKKESVVCEICGHITHGQHLLYAHKRVKHGELTKFACPVCHTVIGSRSAFVVHLRAHADVKPCACNICGKQFRSKSQVARHKLAHMEGRHECSVCAKKFKTPHHLRRHQLIHSGNKPFECHLCEYKCNVKSNVVKHVKSVHGIVDFSFAKQKTPIDDTIETEAFQKGSIVTQQVLNDISVTKGQTITLNELKRLDEKKKREKEISFKEMTQNVKNRKQRAVKHKKDILDDAIASTITDCKTTDNQLNQNQAKIAINMNRTPLLMPVIIQNPNHVYEVKRNATQLPSKVVSSLAVNSEQHLKDVITLHFNH